MQPEKLKDPHAPKPNKTPFNFFSMDARQKAKESYPELTQTEITKRVRKPSQMVTDLIFCNISVCLDTASMGH